MPANKSIRFSCIIPARDPREKKLLELIESIRLQDFPQDEIEIIVSTQGDSEEAKAHGIRQATGDICVMLCADNYFVDPTVFSRVNGILYQGVPHAVYSKHYVCLKKDYSLNRYFSLLGANDPIPWFLWKADRKSFLEWDKNDIMNFRFYSGESYGCNGWFARREILLQADLDHYYPMDVWADLNDLFQVILCRDNSPYMWHRTTDNNLIKFLIRRYRYARDLYCDRKDRRWKVVSNWRDISMLAWFILYSLTGLSVLTSIRGFCVLKDWAWFWHPAVCLGTTFMYGILVCRNILKSVLSFPRWVAGKVSMLALNLSILKRTKTTKTSS